MPHLRLATNFPKGHKHQTPTAPAAGPRGSALLPPHYGIEFVDGAADGEGPLQLMPRPDRWREEQEIAPFPSRDQSPSAPSHTGLPDDLKAGIESISGIDLSDVRVHYNSSEPAALQALAYTQGTDIHVAPGQERHLPHEAWHIVQQAQGRVKPKFQLKGEQINDDQGLEHEADVMGEKALALHVPLVGRRKGEQLLSDKSASRECTAAAQIGRFAQKPTGLAQLVVQRTVATAAEALYKTGTKEVKKRDLKPAFCKKHEISEADLEAVQAAVTELWSTRGSGRILVVEDDSAWASPSTIMSTDFQGKAIGPFSDQGKRVGGAKAACWFDASGDWAISQDRDGHAGEGCWKLFQKTKSGWQRVDTLGADGRRMGRG